MQFADWMGKMKDKPEPLVSICCMTYNHEKYIRQCLEGFVMQKTSFEYEILIHEDASIDNTAKIVKEYELKYPHLFRCVYQTINQFNLQNTLTNILFPMARGKYIALCEGDDYWTDSLKLQRQVDFLEANPDFSLCFHKVLILKDEKITSYETTRKDVTNTTDLAKGMYIYAPSVLFRNIFKDIFISSILGQVNDYILFMYLSRFGKLKEIHIPMAVYRVHKNGLWSGYSEIEKMEFIIDSQRELLNLFSDNIEVQKIIKELYLNNLLFIVEQYYNDTNFEKYSSFLVQLEKEIEYVFHKYLDVKERMSKCYERQNSIYFLLKRIFILILIFLKLRRKDQ